RMNNFNVGGDLSGARGSPLMEYRYDVRDSGSRREMRLLRARDVVTVKMNADAELALGRVDGYGANDVAGAAPLGGRLAGNLFRHLQENFHDFAFGKGRVRNKKDAALREIQRHGPFFGDIRLPNADAKRSLQIVTLRKTAIAGKAAGDWIHLDLLSTKE